MEDGEGRQIDFKNTIIILTSNAGTDTLMKLLRRPGNDAGRRWAWCKALKPELNKIFKPAFLGRLVIIPYFPIRDEALKTDHRAQARQDPAPPAGDPQDRT